tara:strand:- start:2731 stop:5235 length:2505 start_codon:yes stop_codon:yes gene_type:complete
MVVICNKPYPNKSEYDEYFEQYSFPLSDFQKYAIQGIVQGQHALVTAHTGSGKTLPAEFAIQHFAKKNKKVIYTSPIKALSNQKFHDFSQKFPEISFGLFTGDIKTNPDADVLIMTTEILMNYLFTSLNKENSKVGLQFEIDIQNDLACVVFDEVHYINDVDRGQVWEKTILMLPLHVQMVMLSATIDNPEGFAKWCEKGLLDNGGKEVYLASTNHRVVPLTHYSFMTHTESVFKHIRDKVIQKEIKDNTNKILLLQDSNGNFNENNYKIINKIEKYYNNNHQYMKRKHVLNQLATHLRNHEMLPAIVFIFSRKQVEACANDITVPLLEFDSKVAYTVKYECDQIVRRLPNFQEYLDLPEYNHLVSLLEKGIGIHHSGMIPILREIVELMISKKYIKMLFATESFAIGLDCPIKTAVFMSMKKFDGRGERYLHAHEYTQMAGRAGRRGIDKLGYIVHCNNLYDTPSQYEYKKILGGIPQTLVSKYYISYGLILNLLKNGQTNNFHLFSEKSMIYNEIQACISSQKKELAKFIDETKQIIKSKTPESICDMYLEQEEKFKTGSNNHRKKADKEMKRIRAEYIDVENDCKNYKKQKEQNKLIEKHKQDIDYTEQFIQNNTANICSILLNNKFIVCSSDTLCNNYILNNDYELSRLGIIASNIAEIHPLVVTELLESWEYFKHFEPIQIVGLFSCFTNIRLPDDEKLHFVECEDEFVKQHVQMVKDKYIHYDTLEGDLYLQTGINYEEAMMYDMIDLSMKWCLCDNELSCRKFIEHEVKEMNISIGDFTKAMLKIVTISKEWINVFEQLGYVEAQHKFSLIEPMILKYVTTSQSLYV